MKNKIRNIYKHIDKMSYRHNNMVASHILDLISRQTNIISTINLYEVREMCIRYMSGVRP